MTAGSAEPGPARPAAPESTRPTPTRRPWLVGVVVSGAYVLLFGEVLYGLARQWAGDPEYHYGFLLLGVAVFLAWDRRRETVEPQRGVGAGLLGAAVLLFWVGTVAAENFTVRFAALSALAGLVLYYRGWRQLREWWLPFALLAFTIPLPEVVLNSLTLPLQLFASKAALAGLHFRHVPAGLAGNIILLPGGQELFVAEACSGLRSLSALFGLTLLFGGTRLATVAGRGVLLALALPAALAANALRVFVTGFLAYYVGPGITQGASHETVGLVVFLLTLGGVVALLGPIRRWELGRGRRSSRRRVGGEDTVPA